MTKQALYDAFMAGWSAHRQAGPTKSEVVAGLSFDRWYRNATAEVTRDSVGAAWLSPIIGMDFAAVEQKVLADEQLLMDLGKPVAAVRYFGEPGGAGGVEYKFPKRSQSAFDRVMGVEDRPAPPYTSEPKHSGVGSKPKRSKRKK